MLLIITAHTHCVDKYSSACHVSSGGGQLGLVSRGKKGDMTRTGYAIIERGHVAMAAGECK